MCVLETTLFGSGSTSFRIGACIGTIRRSLETIARRARPSDLLVACELTGAQEHGVGHRDRELARERVLLARVEAAQQDGSATGRLVLRAVAELRARLDAVQLARGLPGERAQADDDADLRQQLELLGRVGQAVVALRGERLVGGRRAAYGRADPGAAQRQAVVAMDRRRLVGEPRPVHRGEQPVARTVAREDPARPVAAVRRRSQAEHEDARRGVAEAGDRPAPVDLVPERGALLANDALAPLDQPRAAAALDHALLE